MNPKMRMDSFVTMFWPLGWRLGFQLPDRMPPKTRPPIFVWILLRGLGCRQYKTPTIGRLGLSLVFGHPNWHKSIHGFHQGWQDGEIHLPNNWGRKFQQKRLVWWWFLFAWLKSFQFDWQSKEWWRQSIGTSKRKGHSRVVQFVCVSCGCFWCALRSRTPPVYYLEKTYPSGNLLRHSDPTPIIQASLYCVWSFDGYAEPPQIELIKNLGFVMALPQQGQWSTPFWYAFSIFDSNKSSFEIRGMSMTWEGIWLLLMVWFLVTINCDGRTNIQRLIHKTKFIFRFSLSLHLWKQSNQSEGGQNCLKIKRKGWFRPT